MVKPDTTGSVDLLYRWHYTRIADNTIFFSFLYIVCSDKIFLCIKSFTPFLDLQHHRICSAWKTSEIYWIAKHLIHNSNIPSLVPKCMCRLSNIGIAWFTLLWVTLYVEMSECIYKYIVMNADLLLPWVKKWLDKVYTRSYCIINQGNIKC